MHPTSVALFATLCSIPYACANTVAGTETLVGIVGKDFVLLGADSSVSSGIALTASNLDKIAVLIDPFPESGEESDSAKRGTQQQVICAAAAGNSADCDYLLNILRSQLALAEFEAGVGCDVKVVNCRPTSDDNNRKSDASDRFNSQAVLPSYPGMAVDSLAELARTVVATNLRRSPFQVCMLLAGMAVNRNVETHAVSSPHIAERLQNQVITASAPFLSNVDHPNTAGRCAQTHDVSDEALVPRLFWLDEYGAAQKVEYGVHGYGSALILSILDQGYRKDMTREEATELMRRCFAQLQMRYAINLPKPPCIKCVDKSGCTLIR